MESREFTAKPSEVSIESKRIKKEKVEKPTKKGNLSKGNEPFHRLIQGHKRRQRLSNFKMDTEQERVTRRSKYLKDIQSILKGQAVEAKNWHRILKECSIKTFKKSKKPPVPPKNISTKRKAAVTTITDNPVGQKKIKTEFENESVEDAQFPHEEEEEEEEEEKEIERSLRSLDERVTQTVKILNFTLQDVQKEKQYSESLGKEYKRIMKDQQDFVNDTLQEYNNISAEIREDNSIRHREKSAEQFAGSSQKKIKSKDVQQLLLNRSSGKHPKKKNRMVNDENEELIDDHIKPRTLAGGTNLFRLYRYDKEMGLENLWVKTQK